MLAHALDRPAQDRLVPALGRATGQPVAVGGVEADLTGAGLRDVVIGDLLRADAIEAARSRSTASSPGRCRPTRSASIGPAGAGADRRRRSQRPHDTAGPRRRHHARGRRAPFRRRIRRLRRVVVSGGDLIAAVGGARVSLRDVGAPPPGRRRAGGVSGAATMRRRARPVQVRAGLRRVETVATIRLAALTIDRVVAVGGSAEVIAGDARLVASARSTWSAIAGRRLAGHRRGRRSRRAAPARPGPGLRTGPAAALTVTGDRVPLAVRGRARAGRRDRRRRAPPAVP
ncbi:MAG: hypothetical protein HS111_36055 [Kofleriaceae bacterium]|nr:hypothetical protein [Kofleriaceae bacterium]